MELNLVPLIEAAKGITWQGAVVILSCLVAGCYMARLRLVYGREEREFWRNATPEQIQARAATTATLPKPVKAPPSAAGPLLMLAVFLGCALMPEPGPAPAPSILAHRARPNPASEFDSDLWFSSAQASPRELARVGTGEPGVTPAPGKLPPPGPVRKDCDSTTCKPPGRCERGQCVGSARKPAPTKLAGQAMGASSYAVRAAWQDTEPEAFPERLSDAQWLAQQL